MKIGALGDDIDKDQTAQNMQSGLWSILSDDVLGLISQGLSNRQKSEKVLKKHRIVDRAEPNLTYQPDLQGLEPFFFDL